MPPRWQPNIGSKPERTREEIAALEAAYRISRVFVRLRNGRVPAASWPVDTGRQPTTRWTLIGSDFDIVEWIEAK